MRPPQEITSDIGEVPEKALWALPFAAPVVREHLILISLLLEKTMDHNQAKFSFRLLTRRRDQLLEELRALAPDLVEKLELTLEELSRREHDGLEQ